MYDNNLKKLLFVLKKTKYIYNNYNNSNFIT